MEDSVHVSVDTVVFLNFPYHLAATVQRLAVFFFRRVRWTFKCKNFLLSWIKFGLPLPVSCILDHSWCPFLYYIQGLFLYMSFYFDHQTSLSCLHPWYLSHRSTSISWKIKWSISFLVVFWFFFLDIVSFPCEKWCLSSNKDELCYVLFWKVLWCYLLKSCIF